MLYWGNNSTIRHLAVQYEYSTCEDWIAGYIYTVYLELLTLGRRNIIVQPTLLFLLLGHLSLHVPGALL